MRPLNELLQQTLNGPARTVALACPEQPDIINAVMTARSLKLAEFLLFGNKDALGALLPAPFDSITIIEAKSDDDACYKAVCAVSEKKADILMKGRVNTSTLLSHVLHKEQGLRTDRLLSHVMVCYLSHLGRLILLSDGGLNINPTPDELAAIAFNAVLLSQTLNITHPKVALLSAIEHVNPKIPSTVKCQEAVLAINRLYPDIAAAGPMALDIALTPGAAAAKGWVNVVAGNADILIVPYMEMANILYKGWMFGCRENEAAGLIVGAKAPIILNSRSDDESAKLYSLALASILLEGGR